MFYAELPPEINSGRMYDGPGSGSMLAAAQAWEGLASELQSTVASYSSIVDSLVSGAWTGPSSAAMLAAVTPYLAWIQGTAAQATEASAQAAAAASAYETAFVAHVPPTEITANRAQFAQLVATNAFGQNTAAIAATEIQYVEMWAQDALAMAEYAASSASATVLKPFTSAPQVANAGGTAAQASAVATAAATSVGSAQSVTGTLQSLIQNPLGWLLQTGSTLATDYTDTINGLLNTLFGSYGSAWYNLFYSAVKVPLGMTTQFNDTGLLINFPLSQFLKFAPHPAGAALPKDALGAGLGFGGGPHWARGTLFGSVTPEAHWGRGTLVGSLSVPPSWASATPTVRTVAAALSASGAEVSAAELGEGGLFSSMAMAGMLGSAAGAGAPTIVRSGVRGKIAPIKDLKDAASPEKLKRLVAQISEKPESVQHHNVDQEGLDALLEQLAKKPGIHAVHLKKAGSAKLVSSEPQLG